MKYKVGMYGGSFDPLHIGHVQVMMRAAAVCENLYIVLSYARQRDHIPMEIRYRWIYHICKHMSHVKIILLEDMAVSEEAYDSQGEWEIGRDKVLSQIKQPVDVVFCGSDYKDKDIYQKLYQCEVVICDREEIPISSTQIRQNPYQYWTYLPEVCRPYYVKKVLVVGGESTGKSTLVQNLATLYRTNYVAEVGRDVCEMAGNSEELMIASDFYEILIKHKAQELEAIKHSNRLLFVDTDALTTLWYSQFLLSNEQEIQQTQHLAQAIAAINRFDLILFLEPTVAFVQDGTRNEKIAADRETYSNQIKRLLDEQGLAYVCVDGDYANRLEQAKKLIAQILHIDINTP